MYINYLKNSCKIQVPGEQLHLNLVHHSASQNQEALRLHSEACR